MTAILEARLTRQIHPGLRLDGALTLGSECGIVFGPSGAGKTSLLRSIAGLDRPDSGRIRLGDDVLFDSNQRINRPLRSRRIGMIFQDDLLFPHLDVAGNIGFGLKGLARREAAGRLAEVAALCGVAHLLDRQTATLSGGERQRVGLARALAPRPRLLLCDEPVSALDVEGREALIERLGRIPGAESIPILYVTHNPAEAITLGSRLFLIADGRIIAEGDPLEVLAGRPGPSGLAGLRNLHPGAIANHAADRGASIVRLDGGPPLVVPFHDLTPGTRVVVGVRADDILLARGPIAGLSARNVIAGSVERLVRHGVEAEVIVRTGAVAWIVSVVAPAVSALDLRPGAEVCLIVKARSCRVRIDSSD